MQDVITRIEHTLGVRLPDPMGEAAQLITAMRYATLGGGKRVRALLCHAAGVTCGAPASVLDEIGAAVEMIHGGSLVHDDLPAMDDDVLRRGRPTVHVQFDEATAILAGDALQAQAFLALSELAIPVERRVALVHELAVTIGPFGTAGGQSIDLLNVGCQMSVAQLERMHAMKTGALIRAAIRMGALCQLPDDPDHAYLYHAFDEYGDAVGLAFQVVDDILDVTGNTVTLGKTAGKDAVANKPTYVSGLGIDACRSLVHTLHRRAYQALDPLGDRAGYLRQLADRMVQRVA